MQYKLYRDTERPKRLKRLWRPVEIHASMKLHGETERSKEVKEHCADGRYMQIQKKTETKGE